VDDGQNNDDKTIMVLFEGINMPPCEIEEEDEGRT
jgi:hypothetical protein